MRETTSRLNVAVETAVHSALAEAAQRIFDEFGIWVNDARFTWIDASTASQERQLCMHVHLGTSMAASKPASA